MGGNNHQVEQIFRGSFDLHVTAGPDPSVEQRFDALDVGRQAYESEMAGFVLKSRHYSTIPIANIVNRIYPGLEVAGSITLSSEIGGFNPRAVLAAAKMGAKMVSMPTSVTDLTADVGESIILPLTSGKLRDEILEILEIVKNYDMVLASGHLSSQDTILLFREANVIGIHRMLASGLARVEDDGELLDLVALGAILEYAFLDCMPLVGSATPHKLVESIRRVGVDNCVISTKFGQWMNPPPTEGMRMAIAAFLDVGMTANEVERLVKTTPLKLIK